MTDPVFTTIVIPDADTALALQAVAVNEFKRPNLFPESLKEWPESEDGRFAWAYHAWPDGFTARAKELGCRVVAYKTAAGTRWDAGNREAFTPKMEAR